MTLLNLLAAGEGVGGYKNIGYIGYSFYPQREGDGEVKRILKWNKSSRGCSGHPLLKEGIHGLSSSLSEGENKLWS